MTQPRWETFLQTELEGLILCSGTIRYPSVRAMYEGLDKLAVHGMVVIGLEGLNTDGIRVLPSLGHIADLSSIQGPWHERVKQSVSAARTLLARWEGDVQFVDVSVDDRTSDPS